MLVWLTKSCIIQFHASEHFLFKRPYNVSFPQKRKIDRIVQITNLFFLKKKMVTEKWDFIFKNDPNVSVRTNINWYWSISSEILIYRYSKLISISNIFLTKNRKKLNGHYLPITHTFYDNKLFTSSILIGNVAIISIYRENKGELKNTFYFEGMMKCNWLLRKKKFLVWYWYW